jgi:SRP54-type protein, GTPase domain
MSTPGELLEALGREARARFGNGGEGGTRVYRGRSVEELVPQIQRELGADAIIVRRREGLTGGVLGFFQHAYVEIEAMPGAPGVDLYDEQDEQMPPAPAPAQATAQTPVAPAPMPRALEPLAPPPAPPAYQAAPPAYAAPPPYEPPAPAPPPRYEPPPAAPAPAPVPTPVHAQAPPAWELPTPAPAASTPPPFAAPPPPPSMPPRYTQPAPSPQAASPGEAGSAYVTAHLAALARAGRAAARPPSRPPELTSALPPIPSAGVRRSAPPAWTAELQQPPPVETRQPLPPVLAQAHAPPPPPRPSERRVVAPGSHQRARAGVARSLERCGIGPELAQELIDGASAHALALAPRAGLAQAVRATLAQRIPVAPPLPTKGAAIVMVGAGGTGKTTCCAALLAAYRRGSSLPASCATVTRGGERGELQMILSPYVLKPSPARAPRALRALRRALGEGVVVIDTPSLSPADRTGVRELARLLSELEPERVVVTLPATLGATAAAQLLQALRPLGANSLAVTHADETDQLGVAVEAACRFGLAPEYLLERATGGGWRLRHTDPTALAEKLLP